MQPRVISVLGLVLFSLVFLSACQKRSSDGDPALMDGNPVTTDSAGPQKIGDANNPFTVLKETDAERDIAAGLLTPVNTAQAQRYLRSLGAGSTSVAAAAAPPAKKSKRGTSLTLGFPVGLLGEAQIFGGVITKASDPTNENVGRLKLIDLTPIHVRPTVLENPDKSFSLSLIGCAEACTETKAPSRLVDMPITAVKEAEGLLIVDLATLGDELNLVQMMDLDGSFLQMKTKSSKVVSVDYSVSTLVFDVEVTMVPLKADVPQTETKFTVRWYMRLGTVFHAEFLPRAATPGVGFFMTERSADPKIHRWTLTPHAPGLAPVKYYIKNVPKEYKASFQAAFDRWNATVKAEVGTNLIRYEFVDAGDPKAKLLVAGDPRFNIVEWDLDNIAPYGGLGPSIANQFTGEILSANVLVQGPKIVELYTNWFKVAEHATALRERGLDEEASTLLRDHARSVEQDLARLKAGPQLSMSLGKLKMRVPSQMPQLEDPLFARDDFELLPPGNMDYATYMDGYFQELVGHELGHNIGLRHNFRGNLSAAPTLTLGKVSASIMEYLGRGFRYLNNIGGHDVTSIAYAYNGKKPTVLNGFCTDENVSDTKSKANSPECSRDDATPDPFGFFESRLARAVSLLANPGKPTASTWTVADLGGPLGTAVGGLGLYAFSAPTTATQWTNFFQVPGRPSFTSGVRPFVIKSIKSQLCNPKLDAAIAEKGTEADRLKTAALLAELRAKVGALITPAGISVQDLNCP